MQMIMAAFRCRAYFFLISSIVVMSPAILNGKWGEILGWFLKHISPLKIFWPVISCFIPREQLHLQGFGKKPKIMKLSTLKIKTPEVIVSTILATQSWPLSILSRAFHSQLTNDSSTLASPPAPGKLPYQLTDLSVRSFFPPCSAHTCLLLASWPYSWTNWGRIHTVYLLSV